VLIVSVIDEGIKWLMDLNRQNFTLLGVLVVHWHGEHMRPRNTQSLESIPYFHGRRQLRDVNVHAKPNRGTNTVPVEAMHASMDMENTFGSFQIPNRKIQAAYPALAPVQQTTAYSYKAC
jgi:hypothetical protein